MFPTSSILSGLIVLSAPALGAASWTTPVPPTGGEAEAVLQRVELPTHILRGRDELLALGPKSVPVLLEWLARVAVHEPETELAGADSCRSVAVMCALGATAHDVVHTALVRLGRSSSERDRAAGLEVLAHIGARNDLELAVALVSLGAGAEPASALLRASFERALEGILARDSGADRALADLVPEARRDAQPSIIAVLSHQDGADTLGLLAGLLGKVSSEADASLLLEVGDLAARHPAPSDLLVLERVRGYLGHPDHGLAVLACVALEKLRDHEAVPDMIVLLGDSDPNLSTRAHRALTSLTGLPLPLQPEAWMAWLDEELAWWDERGPACRSALVSGSPTEAAAAVHELAGRRLFQHRAAQILRLGLERPEPDIVREAGRVLATLRVAPVDAEEEARPEERRAEQPRTTRERPVRIPGRIRSRT